MKKLTPVTRLEKYLHAIATEEVIDLTPTNDEEKLLDAIMRGEGESIEINPKTRAVYLLAKVAGAHIIGEDNSQNQHHAAESGCASGDVIYKFREPKTDIEFSSISDYFPRVEEVIIKNSGGKARISSFVDIERVIVDAPLSIDNGGIAGLNSNSYNYEKRYIYLSDKIVDMAEYSFPDSKISGNIVVDCGFSEDKFPTAMAKAVALGIEVNYNIPEPRNIE